MHAHQRPDRLHLLDRGPPRGALTSQHHQQGSKARAPAVPVGAVYVHAAGPAAHSRGGGDERPGERHGAVERRHARVAPAPDDVSARRQLCRQVDHVRAVGRELRGKADGPAPHIDPLRHCVVGSLAHERQGHEVPREPEGPLGEEGGQQRQHGRQPDGARRLAAHAKVRRVDQRRIQHSRARLHGRRLRAQAAASPHAAAGAHAESSTEAEHHGPPGRRFGRTAGTCPRPGRAPSRPPAA
mmetsp:Transcript_16105/g.60974  ORF Transcript_16105/g.60974 Transcript_16105/m.60974 type:complete len:241 (-) Transcript_16105:579-1301(-)